MIVTENEAKTKWCPAANNSGALRDGKAHEKCIASNCMAWRPASDGWQLPSGKIIEADKEPQNSHGGMWIARGYCGLSGVPST